MLFREASIQGRLVNLRAADDLDRWVRLESGRLPAVCVPSHCEVLRLKGKGPIPSTKALHLIEVGRAVLKPDAPFGPFVLPTPPTEQVARAVRYHTPQPSPVVIANGVAGLSSTTELETFYRSYGWFVPLGRGDVHPWDVDSFTGKVQRLTSQIEARSDEFQVIAPTEALTGAAASSSRRRAQAAPPRRRGRCAAARLHDPRRSRAAPRRHRGAASSHLVRRAALAGRAAHARRVVRARCRRNGRRLVARRRRRGSRRVPGGLARRRGRPPRAPFDGRPRRQRWRSRRPPGSCSTRPCARRRCSSAASRSHRSTRRPRRDRRRARRLGARLGRRATALRRQRHERVPAARAGADRVRRGGRRGPAPRPGAARARPRGPARADLAAARRGVARAQPGHAAIAATFLVASLGLALFAVALPLDAPARPARRGRSTRFPRRTSSPRTSRSSSRSCTARRERRSPRHPHRSCASRATSHRERRSRSSRCPVAHSVPCGGWRATSRRSRSRRSAATLAPTPAPLHVLSLPPGRQFTVPVTGTGDDVGVRAFFRSRLGDYVAVGTRSHPGGSPCSCCTAASRSVTRRSRSSSSTS